MENLYTPKVIVALLAVIIAVNGALLYQLQSDSWSALSPTDIPSSGDAPETPKSPETSPNDDQPEVQPESGPDDETGEPETPESAASERPPAESPENDAGSPEGERESPTGASDGAAPEPGDEVAETPFDSQYGAPPTRPGGEGLERIQVALSSLYSGKEGEDPNAGLRLLPTTSGLAMIPSVIPAVIIVVAVISAAAILLRLRR